MFALLSILIFSPINPTEAKLDNGQYQAAISDPHRKFYVKASESLMEYFMNDFARRLEGGEYSWDYNEDGSIQNERTLMWIVKGRDKLKFPVMHVLIIRDGVEYSHWIKAPFLLNDSQLDAFERELRWSMFRLFSMDEEDRFFWQRGGDLLEVDKEPIMMNRPSKE